MRFFGVFHYSDNLNIWLDIARTHRKVHADGVSVREKCLHHGFVDDRNLRACSHIGVVEFPPRKQRNLHGRKVIRANGVIVDVTLVVVRVWAAFDGDVRSHVGTGQHGDLR